MIETIEQEQQQSTRVEPLRSAEIVNVSDALLEAFASIESVTLIPEELRS
jgi:hypothetical protein